jgi:hypothetical protein
MGRADLGDGMRTIRIALVGLGLLLLAVGIKYLLTEDFSDLSNAVVWLGGGVIAHDAFLAPATLLLMAVSTRLLPHWLRGPVTVGFVVLATVTIAAVPVLGRFGARPDNPTLLDRHYLVGWLGFAAVVCSVVMLAAVRERSKVERKRV